VRIAIVVQEFDPSRGYLEYYLSRGLAALGHKVFVFTYGSNKRLLRERTDEGFEVIRIPSLIMAKGINLPSIREIVYIARFLMAEKPDIIHCSPLYLPLSLIFIKLNLSFSCKIVGSLITGEYSINSFSSNLKYSLAKIVTEHFVKNKVSSFFAIDDGWKEITQRLFNIPSQKINEVPLGADAGLFKPDSTVRTNMRSLLGIAVEDIVVVYSGKIIQSKKLHLLLKAIAPIIKKNLKVKLLILGEGDLPYRRRLIELSSDLEILNNVIFHSWVPRTRLPNFYNASDIAVWPGSVSISIIEAASVGLPVVVQRSIITKFAISNGNGFAFEHDNVLELNEYLGKLITNHDLRKKMGKQSRLLILQKLNWESIVHQYLSTYQNALKR